MVLSRAQRTQVMTHILEEVLLQLPDSNIHRAMTHNLITSPHDLCVEDEKDIELFQYNTAAPTNPQVLALLPRGNIGLLKAFKAYVAHQEALGTPIDDASWTSITQDDFDAFRISAAYTARSAPVQQQCIAPQPGDAVQDF